MKHLIDPLDLTTQETDALLALADDIISRPDDYYGVCARKKLAALFFEPSTRTRLSFEAAMLDLGGNVINVSSASSSSASKGETVTDTARVVGAYADIIAIRHPREGAALAVSQVSPVPVINAGDGGHQHPTQTLTDLLTIHRETGRLSNLTIGLCGDLKFGRTVHSLIRAMARYDGVSFVLISPEDLTVPEYVAREAIAQGCRCIEARRIEDVIAKLDVLYMTRVQRERFFNEADYLRLRDYYILDKRKLSAAKADMIVMHPLPRVNEIATEIDSDPRACYFKQAAYGKFARMALIMTLLGIEPPKENGGTQKC